LGKLTGNDMSKGYVYCVITQRVRHDDN